jgi:hypothetical protein
MADELSQALCGAYKDTLKSGVAMAKTGSELRKAKHEAFKLDPSLINTDDKRKQDIEAQRAFLEMSGKNYDELVEKAEAEKEPVVEKVIRTDIMDLYVKKI